jgi:GWxTD domain-containing protein
VRQLFCSALQESGAPTVPTSPARTIRFQENRMNKAILCLIQSLGLLAFTSLSVVAQTSKNAPDVYQRWLEQDVIYLITAEERLAFLALKSAAEREQFIEQFWQRRDFVPQTEENEFRDRHYQRMAQANMTYGFGNRAGWQTDRGRIYILYGEPDEVNQDGIHETWLYHSRPVFRGEAKFQFTDLNRTGEYRLRQQ